VDSVAEFFGTTLDDDLPKWGSRTGHFEVGSANAEGREVPALGHIERCKQAADYAARLLT
jgi:hypothetical protein